MTALFVGAVLGATALIAQSVDPPVTDVQRAGLALNADSVWHGDFGFAFPHPGSTFGPNAALQGQLSRQLEGHPEMALWVLTDAQPPRSVIITLTTFATLDEMGFKRFAAGVKEGFARSTPRGESLVWTDSAGDYRLTMQHPSGLYLVLRCLSHRRPVGAVAVCVQTTASTPNALDFVRAGFHFAPVAR